MAGIEGFIDYVAPDSPIKGWARSIDPDQAAPLITTLLVNDTVVGHGRTVFREDLGEECGFEIDQVVPISMAMFQNGEAIVLASIGDHTLNLPVWQPAEIGPENDDE